MYWNIALLPDATPDSKREHGPAGRYVIHRHFDGGGPHRDLRLEQAGHLAGWRFEQPLCAEGAWAVEKGPHPLRWLDHDGDAAREDAGLYTVIAWAKDVRELFLDGRHGTHILRAERMPLLSPEAARALHVTMREMALEPAALAGILRDGVTARRRALARSAGLGASSTAAPLTRRSGGAPSNPSASTKSRAICARTRSGLITSFPHRPRRTRKRSQTANPGPGRIARWASCATAERRARRGVLRPVRADRAGRRTRRTKTRPRVPARPPAGHAVPPHRSVNHGIRRHRRRADRARHHLQNPDSGP